MPLPGLLYVQCNTELVRVSEESGGRPDGAELVPWRYSFLACVSNASRAFRVSISSHSGTLPTPRTVMPPPGALLLIVCRQ